MQMLAAVVLFSLGMWLMTAPAPENPAPIHGQSVQDMSQQQVEHLSAMNTALTLQSVQAANQYMNRGH